MSGLLNHSTNTNELFIHLNLNMMKQIFKTGFYAITILLLLISCQKQEIVTPQPSEEIMTSGRTAAEITNVFKGPNVALGEGHARSWIRINHLDMPLELGIEITESALSHLPHGQVNVVLPLHHKARKVTPFEHIYLGYNEHGHQPVGVFNVAHFDAHFYYTSNEERLAIPAITPATLPLFTLAPPPGYMAPTYFQAGPEPQMGQHWIPPPFTFMPFSKVMVYGTYNGELTFIEPMVTVQHMLAGGSSNSYLQPARFAEAGNYPTMYNIYKDAKSGDYNITLSNFVPRLAN